MTYKLHLLYIIFYFASSQICGQEQNRCRPAFVVDLEVNDNFTLSWKPHPNETCSISHFLVYVSIANKETVYNTEETSMDVRFLPTCVRARITVTAISTDDEEGFITMLSLDMPLPPEADLSLTYLNLQQPPRNRVTLLWDVKEEWKHCAKRFRLLVYNEHSEPIDIYIQTSSVTIGQILPCSPYTFGVTAVYTIDKEGPITLLRYFTPSSRIPPPSLQKVTLGVTDVNLEWQLESYRVNRCEVSSIVIESPPYFKAAFPVRDNPDRPIVSTRITGLQPDILYYLNVSVINSAGPSVPILIAVQTLANN